MSDPFSDPLLATTPPTARVPPWATRGRVTPPPGPPRPTSFADLEPDDDDDGEPADTLTQATPPPAVDLPSEAPKRRGRKPGSTNAGTGKGAPRKKLKSITKLLMHSHMIMASAFHAEELLLDEDEAKDIASALADVLAYYKVDIDGKYGAVITLCFVLIVVYGTRAGAIWVRVREQRHRTIEGTVHAESPYTSAA